MDDRFPAPVYAETVLAPNFEHAKKHLLDPLIQIHYAHTRMLAKQGIITAPEERTLTAALDGLDRGRIVERELRRVLRRPVLFHRGHAGGSLRARRGRERCTPRAAATISPSRLYRMTARQELLATATRVAELRAVLLDLAAKHLETVMPAHTHTQPAQPTTLAHYLLAACEFLDRDAARIQSAFARVNLCPLGAAAITTSGFPIDRDETARLLGFEGLAENSYGAIAAIDYITECAAVVAVAMVSLGKLIQDLLLWSTREFGFLTVFRCLRAIFQHHAAEAQSGGAGAYPHSRQPGSGRGASGADLRAQYSLRRHQR